MTAELTTEERVTLWDAKGESSSLVTAVERIITARVAAAEQRAERVTAAVDLCDEAVAEHDRHLKITARSAPDHRPCESGARAQFATRIRAILADPAPREYDDGGRVREAVERAERDAEVAASALREAADDWREGYEVDTRQWLRDRAAALDGGESDV